ncbi:MULTISPECIES: hypothetical protein [unclassified Paraflavitalea]|uniref:hypothetical protein n=1 Tax=unclassified Paraflavitalea TaxID=2798305 RepID=UPI003D33BC5E
MKNILFAFLLITCAATAQVTDYGQSFRLSKGTILKSQAVGAVPSGNERYIYWDSDSNRVVVKIGASTFRGLLFNGEAAAGGGSVSWGGILGTLSAQSDLQTALNAKQATLTLTTTGTSGAATLVGSTLNIPQYSGGGGIGTLNTLTATTQTFATGTTGTDFNISSATSTHTFNIPDASATARGLITTGTQTFAGAKSFSTSVAINNASGFSFRNNASATNQSAATAVLGLNSTTFPALLIEGVTSGFTMMLRTYNNATNQFTIGNGTNGYQFVHSGTNTTAVLATTQGSFESANTFAPTSSSTDMFSFYARPTINQTGTASGMTGGFAYIPTATSVLGKEYAFLASRGSLVLGTLTRSTDIDSRRAYINGSVGINKDSIPYAQSISSQTILMIDTATGQVIRTGSSVASTASNLVVINDADYTVASGVTNVVYSNLTAGRTITLPAASSNTNRRIKITHGGGGAFNITTSVAIRQNASTTTTTIAQSKWVELVSNGTDWYIVANN